MKKAFALILVLVFLFGVMGCQNAGVNENDLSSDTNMEDESSVINTADDNKAEAIVNDENETEEKVVMSIMYDPETGDATTTGGFLVEAAYISEVGTPYHVQDGEEYLYITEDHPAVQKIIEATDGFCMTATTRSYETMTGREGFEYFTEAFKKHEEDSGRPLMLTSFYNGYELVLEGIGVKERVVKFDVKGTTAEVKCTFDSKIVSSKETFEGDGIEDGILTGIMLFTVVPVEDEWLIDGLVVIQ